MTITYIIAFIVEKSTSFVKIVREFMGEINNVE
jgi:hypothetical protein